MLVNYNMLFQSVTRVHWNFLEEYQSFHNEINIIEQAIFCAPSSYGM